MSSGRPRVLVDVTTLLTPTGRRGIGRYARTLLRGLEEAREAWSSDLSIEALVGIRPGGRLDVEPDLHAAAALDLPAAGKPRSLPLARRTLSPGALRRAGVDLVHYTEPFTPPYLPSPRVVTCHDLFRLKYASDYLGLGAWQAPFRRLGEWQRYRTADRIVAISERTRRDLLRMVQVPAERVAVVPHGVALGEVAAESEAAPAQPYALYVGNHGDPRKNLDGILAALAVARKEEPLRLLLAGVVSSAADRRLEELAARHGVRDAVEPLGYVDDRRLAALYRGARALLFLSVDEGFGFPVVEAMALGCPVIVQDDSGCEELCGAAGVVVPPGDTSAAGLALIKLRDPQQREPLVAAGRERARHFRPRRMAEQTADVYRAALAARSSTA